MRNGVEALAMLPPLILARTSKGVLGFPMAVLADVPLLVSGGGV